MKESKILLFIQGESESYINKRINELEKEGWEVVEHSMSVNVIENKTAMSMSKFVTNRNISVLIQRIKDNV